MGVRKIEMNEMEGTTMQVVTLETDIDIPLDPPSPSLVDPFERGTNGQRGPARGAWSVQVVSNQAGTRFGGVYGGDPPSVWGSPNGYWYTSWLELAWLKMDNCLTGGDLVSSLKGGAVGRESAQLERPSVGRTFEVWRGQPTQMRYEKSYWFIVAMMPEIIQPAEVGDIQ
jgi:hypothetical protein